MTGSDGATDRGHIRAAGDRAWLIEPGPSIGPAEFALALRHAGIAGIEDILPAATTVLVTVVSPRAAESVRRAAGDLMRALTRAGGARDAVLDGTTGEGTVSGTTGGGTTGGGTGSGTTSDRRTEYAAGAGTAAVSGRALSSGSPTVDVSRGTTCRTSVTARANSPGAAGPDPVVIAVHYVGEDLAQVAELLGTSVRAVIDRHTSTLWRCEFVGFAPGFGYLRAPHEALSVPRRERARTSVPAGAVALAGGYSAVYPRSSPGGWQLIGYTEAVLWDERRDPPALIRAGGAVRFVEAGR